MPHVSGFKRKLVVYFLLLSLVPTAAVVWSFMSVSSRSETRTVDEGLQAGLRIALAGYQSRVDAASAAAARLARDRRFQVALQRHDRRSLAAMVARVPGASVATGRIRIGRLPAQGVRREADVVTSHGLAGIVTVSLRVDAHLAEALRAQAGLTGGEVFAVLDGGEVAASSPRITGQVPLTSGRVATVRVGRARYRALVAPALADLPGVSFAVLSPQARIDAANASARDRLLLGLLATVLLVALVAYLEGRSIVRSVRGLSDTARAIARGSLGERVPVRGSDELAALGHAFNEMAEQLESRLDELEAERGRLRSAITRFGEALAATHDVDELLRVVVEAAVEGTGASGAVINAEGVSVRVGDPRDGGEMIELPLSIGGETLGSLFLTGPGFDDDQRKTAASLASHAAVALENARLHRIVERQALIDGLTGIANRRQLEDAFVHEIARADRLGLPLTLVLADLDDFKTVNDRHGHAVGDDVLREFASVLRATVREADLAGRWGGEEFVLLLSGTDAVGGSHLAERVRASLNERSFSGRAGAVVEVTCSFGVAQHRVSETDRQLFAAADRALYEAKRRGKNRVEVDAAVRSF
jgi:two-component system cell cycle response regulator